MKVREDVYFYQGSDGHGAFLGRGKTSNSYVIDQGDELWLIDPGARICFAPSRLFGRMRKDGLNPSSITKVLLTHAHPDHVNALPAIKRRCPQAKVLVHPAEGALLSGGWDYFWKTQQGACLGLHRQVFPMGLGAYKMAAAYRYGRLPGFSDYGTVRNGDVIRGSRVSLEVMHLPGHSPGHLGFFAPSRLYLFSGDLINPFKGNKPTLNLPSADYDQYKRSLERLKQMKIDLLGGGHGSEPVVGPQAVDRAVADALEKLELARAITWEQLKSPEGARLKDFRGLFAESVFSRSEQSMMPFAFIKSLRKESKVVVSDRRFFWE